MQSRETPTWRCGSHTTTGQAEHASRSTSGSRADTRGSADESLTDGLYVFALAEAAAPTGSRLDLEVAGRSAQRVVKLRRRGSSLAAAVALWMAEMREALAARPPGVLRRIPKDRAELPEALSEAFTERRAELYSLLNDVCPGLADRVVRTLGFRGFHAIVLPAQKFTIPVGGGQRPSASHRLLVQCRGCLRATGRLHRSRFRRRPSTRVACEMWLRDSAAQAALKDTVRVLSDLLPGSGHDRAVESS